MNRFYEAYGMESAHERREWENRDKAPAWANFDDKPCSCGVEAKTIGRKSGYSDSLYLLKECSKCRSTWTVWLEG